MLQSFRNTWKAARYLVTGKIDPNELYIVLGSLIKDERTGIPLVNMGYWKEIKNYKHIDLSLSNEKMFQLVADGAQISENDEVVLDVGCGYSSNMIFCAQKYKAKKYLGLNLALEQIAVGNQFIEKFNLKDKVAIQYGSALDMPFEAESIDKMVSVEAAFHFPPRDAFFKEAHRCLKKGGILSLSDLVIVPKTSWWEGVKLWSVKKGLHVPDANIYDIQTYKEKVEAAGFEVLSCESIAPNVVSHFFKWFWGRPKLELLQYNVLFSAGAFGFLFYPIDYVHIVARKK
ncbi:MAG: SAM-dependent methyltransferase [Bacteroidia bacterium]